jgi:hypothetical protein
MQLHCGIPHVCEGCIPLNLMPAIISPIKLAKTKQATHIRYGWLVIISRLSPSQPGYPVYRIRGFASSSYPDFTFTGVPVYQKPGFIGKA